MKDYLISLFIDNELDLDEKREFVNAIGENHSFRTETIDLLEQEKLLRSTMTNHLPAQPAIPLRKRFEFILRGWKPALAGFSMAVFILFAVVSLQLDPAHYTQPPQADVATTLSTTPHRFVLYLPDVQQASIVGSFSSWSPIPMQKIGDSGYWSLILDLDAGEHKYNYMVENNNRIPDPTIQDVEQDDFGGVNSIIQVGAAI